MTAPAKLNKTLDLTDEQYMEQIHLLAQAVAAMPGQSPEHPNVGTPPPIRARWATYLVGLGVRINPEVATHKLLRTGPVAAGNHAPHEFVRLTRDDMWARVRQMVPETIAAYERGDIDREGFLAGVDGDVRTALDIALQAAEAERAAEK